MSEISIVMPVYNGEIYIAEAIKSVLKQSFSDFEFIIVDDGSTDNTLSVIRTFEDSRIRLITSQHDFIASLNLGMDNASGKYIARMDADDIMHIDRLRVQHTIMEEEKNIAVCATWMKHIGTNILQDHIASTQSGLINNALFKFLKGNYLFHPTVMIRTAFLRAHGLVYENYPYAEDFKFWTEIAKKGGQFYIDSQPLLYYRISDTQVSNLHIAEQQQTTECIINEILDFMIQNNKHEYPELLTIFSAFKEIQNKGLITRREILDIFRSILAKKGDKLVASPHKFQY